MIARPDESGHRCPEALHRFVRCHSGDPRAADSRELSAWLAADPAHRDEYERFNRIWTELDQLGQGPFPELDEARAWWGAAPSGQTTGYRIRRWRAVRQVSAGAFAALVLLIAGAYWWSMVRVEVTDYRTDKGEQRTVNLGDGSTVMLSTDTALSVELSGRRRTVVLQRGEALFSVRHETDRPFAVLAANGTVRDIGTRFTVYRSSDRVRVAVVEGVVEVQTQSTEQFNQVAWQASRAARAESATQAGERTVLTEGDRVWYGSDGRLTAVQKVDRELITAGFHGKLVFDAVPLARVIEEVSRYRDEEIRILDPTLSSLQISGVFHQDNLDGLWKALEHALPVTVTSVHPNLVILERTQGRQPIPLRPVTERSAAGENL